MECMRNYLTEYRHELQRTFTGTSGTPPEWVSRLAEGDDAGYHLPDSAVWAVHGHLAAIVAGIRVLLMQALHPGALAGVYEHSDFQKDPLGRLANTIRWIFTVTYGSKDAAESATAMVRKMHQRVHGTYVDGNGQEQQYSANDPELLRWVHVTYADSFITANRIWGKPLPGGNDAYVREWAGAGRLMGVENPPVTEAQVREELEEWRVSGVLRADERLAETVSFIRNPPLSPLLRPGYRILFAAAVASLEPQYREMLGMKRAALGPVPLPVVTGTRAVLAMVRFALGRQGPSEQAARQRLQRLGFAS
ncbi:oxygenase MpaB family protein [Paenarthrobacter ilicis]|uniref:oxygenase MpaB family protein n=1 Tax=Paenarthrobacter ilicis TaxID=43665 RepID=UPI0028CFE558|nr:oxygenase MpaB family protein [Paenarthrobacter ilicis]